MLDATLTSIITAGAGKYLPPVKPYILDPGKETFGKHINLAVELSQSEYTCITIADTIWTTNVMRQVYELLEEKKGQSFVAGALRLNRNKAGELSLYHPSYQIAVLNLFLFRTDDWYKIGGMNPFFDGWGGYELDFLIRAKESGVILFPILYNCYFHLEHPVVENKDDQIRNGEMIKTSLWTGKEWVRT